MKHLLILLSLVVITSCSAPPKTTFTPQVLNETFVDTNGNNKTLKAILNAFPNQTIVINLWASWCGDCIASLPKFKALQQQYPNAAYVFLSIDKNQNAWQAALQHFQIKGHHYFVPNGWDSNFANYINLNWIPRYMVVKANGNILLYNAENPTDKTLITILKQHP